MLLLLYILVSIFLFITILLALTWRLGVSGYYNDSKDISSVVLITVGGEKRGCAFKLKPALEFGFGPYGSPWFNFSVGSSEKSSTKKKKQKKSFETKQLKNRLAQGKRTFAAAVKYIHWDNFELEGKGGFSNPMITGLAMGTLSWLEHYIPEDKAKINVLPVFTGGSTNDLKGKFALRMRPLAVAFSAGITYIRYNK